MDSAGLIPFSFAVTLQGPSWRSQMQGGCLALLQFTIRAQLPTSLLARSGMEAESAEAKYFQNSVLLVVRSRGASRHTGRRFVYKCTEFIDVRKTPVVCDGAGFARMGPGSSHALAVGFD